MSEILHEVLSSEPCAGCGAQVYWVRREFTREYAQVDALPSMTGTVIIDLDAQIYRVPPLQGRVYPLYDMHFMSCPLTSAWRGSDPSSSGLPLEPDFQQETA